MTTEVENTLQGAVGMKVGRAAREGMWGAALDAGRGRGSSPLRASERNQPC